MAKLVVVWPRVAVTNPSTGQEVIVPKDKALPDYVDDFTRGVLSSTGAVRLVDDNAPATPGVPVPVRLPEQPPLSSEMARQETGTLAGDAAARIAADEQAGRPRSAVELVTRPADDADDETWRRYAVNHPDPKQRMTIGAAAKLDAAKLREQLGTAEEASVPSSEQQQVQRQPSVGQVGAEQSRQGGQSGQQPEQVPRPANNASLDEWVRYAVAHPDPAKRMTEPAAREIKSRDKLREMVG